MYICLNTLVKCHVSTFGLLKLLVQSMVVSKFNKLSMIYHMSGSVVFSYSRLFPILGVFPILGFSYSRLFIFSVFLFSVGPILNVFLFSVFSYSRYIFLF